MFQLKGDQNRNVREGSGNHNTMERSRRRERSMSRESTESRERSRSRSRSMGRIGEDGRKRSRTEAGQIFPMQYYRGVDTEILEIKLQ